MNHTGNVRQGESREARGTDSEKQPNQKKKETQDYVLKKELNRFRECLLT